MFPTEKRSKRCQVDNSQDIRIKEPSMIWKEDIDVFKIADKC